VLQEPSLNRALRFRDVRACNWSSTATSNKRQGQYTALRFTQRLLDAGWLRRPCGFQSVFPAPRAALHHAPLRPSGRDDETGWPHL